MTSFLRYNDIIITHVRHVFSGNRHYFDITHINNDMLNNCGAQIPQQCDFLCCENGIFNFKWVPDYLDAAQGK